MPNNSFTTYDENCGIDIVKKALDIPFKQICINAGVSGDTMCEKLYQNTNENVGYNAKTDTFVDMFKDGIIDPAKVTITALKSAVAVAGTLLTTECAIVNNIEE